MGNIIGISIDIPCDQAVSACCGCFGKYNNYVHSLVENVENLNNAMQRLTELRDDVTTRVSVCENNGLQPLATVQGWLSRVADIEEQVSTLLLQKKQETDRLCVGGYCSKSCISTYKYGKRVVRKLTTVKDLTTEGAFEEVGQEGPTSVADERPIRTTVGRNALVDNIWSSVMENTISILGMYGMGGVGKTTLLTCINNKFLNAPNDFDIVIWVSVSREVQIQRIQDDIGKKLGIFNEGWERRRQDEKAVAIFNKLRHKKLVLLLDDIWTRLDLTELGIPVPNAENGCKIIFNTRFHNICGLMEADKEIKVECLEWNDAWELFQIRAGRQTPENDAEIFQCAQRIARKCQGLPLALTTIGVSLRSKKTVEEWENALDDLTTSMTRFEDVVDAILPLLKFSFDEIKDEKTRSSFLFCALLPEDSAIERDELVDYLIGEGILDGYANRNTAARRGYEIIRNLVNACLLIQEGNRYVKMHDLIRQMALWVASDSTTRTHGRVNEITEVQNPDAVKRMSLMNHQIGDITSFRFPNLLTLIARRNAFQGVSSGFFLSLQNLKVLDLSQNQDLVVLPEQVSELVSLQYLNLSRTSINGLPKSLGKLVRLKYLNLENTPLCHEISVVLSLHNLQSLRLHDCGSSSSHWGTVLTLENLAGLSHLEVLSISLAEESTMSAFLNLQNLADSVRLLSLNFFSPDSVDISSFTRMSGLQSLVMYHSSATTVFVHPDTARNQRLLSRNFSFHYLSNVTLELFPRLKDLTWLVLAPNLTRLTLSDFQSLEEVIKESETDSFVVVQTPHAEPFLKLKDLTLIYLPKLKSVNQNPLRFPCLEHITVVDCPELKKLPLNSESANRGLKLVIQGSQEWINNIEWEDEATKQAFTLSY